MAADNLHNVDVEGHAKTAMLAVKWKKETARMRMKGAEMAMPPPEVIEIIREKSGEQLQTDRDIELLHNQRI